MAQTEMGRASGQLSPAHVEHVRAFIAANLGAPLPVSRLAESIKLSPFHFARTFKNATGTTPHAYITSERLKMAKMLLAGTPLKISSIAQQVGFATAAHFTAVFREDVGMPPGRYRRLQGVLPQNPPHIA